MCSRNATPATPHSGFRSDSAAGRLRHDDAMTDVPFHYLSPQEQAKRLAEADKQRHLEDVNRRTIIVDDEPQTSPLSARLRDRAELFARMSSLKPQALDRRVLAVQVRAMDSELRDELGADADVAFRGALRHPTNYETRALGATARGIVGDKDFTAAFYAALQEATPLLNLSTRVPLPGTRSTTDFGFTITNPAAGDVVADGGALTSGEPTFGGAGLTPFAYKRLLTVSAETVADSYFNAEDYCAGPLARHIAGDFEADLWGGDGTNAPEGLLAGLSTTTAASATVVSIDDVAALLGDLPAAAQSSPNLAIICNPAVWFDHLAIETEGTSGAGGRSVPASVTRPSLWGIPVYFTSALAAPATTTKPLVVGDFGAAYLTGVAPLRIETNTAGGFNGDTVSVRVTLRADGRRMYTAAARALVMA